MLERKATYKSIGTYTREKIALSGLLVNFFKEPEHIAHERKNRKDLLKLLKLEEYELADIGLSKADVGYVLSMPLTTSSALELDHIRRRSKSV